ncbi:hypothetical protein SLE2022_178390 [Rubroshorea leprosula]
MLKVLDIRSNTLSGSVPQALKRPNAGFQYENNPALCGTGFSNLKECTDSRKTVTDRPEPIKPDGLYKKCIPESTKSYPNCRENNYSMIWFPAWT